jgi:hypothetical protein
MSESALAAVTTKHGPRPTMGKQDADEALNDSQCGVRMRLMVNGW